ncbi:MAG TPA: LssY C-terminal domain-containing protein [Candidatus Sulfotelmatobacter sp.]|nr:LssY C-terminal domain-containing protein [Candidatus Sulfotelmatobacter sp.]
MNGSQVTAILCGGLAAVCAFTAGARAPNAQAQSAAASGQTVTIEIAAAKQWVDTNLDLRGGEKLRITATGSAKYPPDKKHPEGRTFGPDGLERAYLDLLHQYAVSGAGQGALIGRLGPADFAQAFLVGESKTYTAPVAGRLFLGINQSEQDAESASGAFHVTIEVTAPGGNTPAATNPGGPPESRDTLVTRTLVGLIPRRVSDAQGNPGDMVNALIIGEQAELENVFAAAGWVRVDTEVKSTIFTAVFDSLEKRDYLTMPMSALYLFGRAQDYGYAHAEPLHVAMSRNHLRVWKTGATVDARPVWCVAATHDVGFERDQRNNGVTHKIDPAVDGEREYVNGTLSATGFVMQRGHVAPADAVTAAKTATGGEFHSDGRILVLVLKRGIEIR